MRYTIKILILACFIALSCSRGKTPVYPEQVSSQPEMLEGEISLPSLNFYYARPLAETDGGYPLLLVISPSGDGRMAVQQFKELVLKYRMIVIGLDDVRNNVSGFEQIILNSINTAAEKLPVNRKEIYMAGFSGGARMAFQYAVNHGATGLVMCGAGMGQYMQQKLPLPVVLVAGMRDFNMSEQYYPPFSAIAENPDLLSMTFDGGHEWPPAGLLSDALCFLLRRNGQTVPEIKCNCDDYNYLADQYLQSGDYYQAYKILEKTLKSCPETQKQKASGAMKQLRENPYFRDYLRKFENALREEMSRNSSYTEALQSRDSIWWKKEIDRISRLSGDAADRISSDSNTRTLGYLGLLLFSRTNAAVQGSDREYTENLLSIYERLESENPDVFYFRAIQSVHQGDTAGAIAFLERSKELGFSDLNRTKGIFSENMISLVFNTKNP